MTHMRDVAVGDDDVVSRPVTEARLLTPGLVVW